MLGNSNRQRPCPLLHCSNIFVDSAGAIVKSAGDFNGDLDLPVIGCDGERRYIVSVQPTSCDRCDQRTTIYGSWQLRLG
jgi:hypothetical protein